MPNHRIRWTLRRDSQSLAVPPRPLDAAERAEACLCHRGRWMPRREQRLACATAAAGCRGESRGLLVPPRPLDAAERAKACLCHRGRWTPPRERTLACAAQAHGCARRLAAAAREKRRFFPSQRGPSWQGLPDRPPEKKNPGSFESHRGSITRHGDGPGYRPLREVSGRERPGRRSGIMTPTGGESSATFSLDAREKIFMVSGG